MNKRNEIAKNGLDWCGGDASNGWVVVTENGFIFDDITTHFAY